MMIWGSIVHRRGSPKQRGSQRWGIYCFGATNPGKANAAPKGEEIMSKNDKIGGLVCSLPGMDPKFLGALKDIASRLNHRNKLEAEAWYKLFTEALQRGLPKPGAHIVFSANLEVPLRACAIAEATHVFQGSIDSRFTTVIPDEQQPTLGTIRIEVFGLSGGSLEKTIALFRRNLDELCLTQEQIISFAESDHLRSLRLRQNCDAVSFLFKAGGKYLVATIGVDCNNELEIGLDDLSDRFVHPPENSYRFFLVLADNRSK
jgi:hypothetical protein